MPVVLPPDAFEAWLDCRNVDAETATALCVPARDGLLEAYEVSPAVNARQRRAELIEPAPPEATPAEADADVSAERKKKPRIDERQGRCFRAGSRVPAERAPGSAGSSKRPQR